MEDNIRRKGYGGNCENILKAGVQDFEQYCR